MVFVAKVAAYNQYIVDSIREFLGDRVLDVGCGIGNTTSLLNRPLVVGMDVSDYYLDEFRKRLPEIPVIKHDISNVGDLTKLREFRFDTVFCSNVLEHVEDDEKALSNIYEILDVGGLFVSLVPNYPSLYGSMDKEDLHYRRYTKTTLRETLIRAGFKVEEQFCINFPGIFWWYISGKILKKTTSGELEAGIINKVVPLVKRIDRVVAHSMGLSLIGIARK